MVKLRKREESAEDFQMAPMIDLVFLLLVFFMCVSSMSVGAMEAISLPQSAQELQEIREHAVVMVYGNGGLEIAGQFVTLAQAQQQLQQLAADGARQVLIRADASTNFRSVRPILAACATAGIHTIHYAVEPLPVVP